MIEIVFGESACGSLKIAQTYGKGKYRGSAVSIFMRHEDGSVPSSDEMKKAQLQAQEQERIAWENAIPLGGKSCDVYCFDMALSVGDISDNGIGEQRKNVLKKMLSVWFVEDLDYQVEEKIQKIKTTLSSVIERYVAGEEVRIWYSYNPDELCGMYWLMKQLRPLNCQTTIYLVKFQELIWKCLSALIVLPDLSLCPCGVPKGVPVCLLLLSWAHAPFRWFHCCRLSGLYHTFRNRGNF